MLVYDLLMIRQSCVQLPLAGGSRVVVTVVVHSKSGRGMLVRLPVVVDIFILPSGPRASPTSASIKSF